MIRDTYVISLFGCTQNGVPVGSLPLCYWFIIVTIYILIFDSIYDVFYP